MILTAKQQAGLKIAVERYRAGEPYTCIAGYAGTGKSTLVKFIVEALDIDPNNVCYIAYTGKAAKVLQEKGCANAMTAHRLLFKSFQRLDGSFVHMKKNPLDHYYDLVVVDEISMLPDELWQLLLSHKMPIICLGDPFQLPPIGNDNGVLAEPHIFLDEIMRQAAESEIIRVSMDIRGGKSPDFFKGKEVQIIKPNEVVGGMYNWADQILVAKNFTRRRINTQMRKMLFDVDTDEPIAGDKIICLHNDWEKTNQVGDVMVNGSIGTIKNITLSNTDLFFKPYMTADFYSDDYSPEEYKNSSNDLAFRNIHMDYKLFTEGIETINSKNYRQFPRWCKRPQTFDYGYCITCHKAQGSEYDKVLVFEEHLKSNDHFRWLYTAVTRAKEKLILVKEV